MLKGSQPIGRIIKGAQALGGFKPIEYVQIIARVCQLKSKKPYAKHWHPEVEPSMENFYLREPQKLVKYMLHAKHSKNSSVEAGLL